MTETKVEIKQNFDFMLKIDKEIDMFKTVLENFANRELKSLNADKIYKAIDTVPGDVEISGKNARSYLRNETTSVSNKIEKYRNLFAEISEEIAFNPSAETIDFTFVHHFRKWSKTKAPSDKENVQRVKKELSAIRSKYNEMHEKFEEEEAAINEMIKFTKSTIDLINSSGDDMSQKFILTNIRRRLYMSKTELSELLVKLQNVKIILKDYNTKRVRWAEFLMGMRALPTLPRTTAKQRETMAPKNFRI